MVAITKKNRKSPVLTPSSIPCLRRLPTINITQGCMLGCTYCYIKGYHDYPGPGRIVLYDNTAELVRKELSRKRQLPSRVYFSPSSDAFQPLPEIQQGTYDTMDVLLEAGIEVSFLTKGFVTTQFIELFSKYPALIHAQIGIASLDRGLWHTFEPNTASPSQRIETIRDLIKIGVATSARLDPLIPNVSDTTSSVIPLLQKLSDAGATFAAASYLFLRPAFFKQVAQQLTKLGVNGLDPYQWTYQQFTDGCGGGKCIDEQQRRESFDRLVQLGRDCGINIAICRCKNPTLAKHDCHIAGAASRPVMQSTQNNGQLF